MKRAVVLFLLGLGLLYLVQGGVPSDWFGGSGASLTGPIGAGSNLGQSMNNALQRTADQF